MGGRPAADLLAEVDALRAEVDALTDDNAGLRVEVGALVVRAAALEGLLAGVTRAEVGGYDTLTLSGVNLQLVNGAGGTATANGLGNLIVGYHEDHTDAACYPSATECTYNSDDAADARTGSHMLVVGPDHGYTGFGGIVSGSDNATTAAFASVTGGQTNTARGQWASVTGGAFNIASGGQASVAGGSDNVASGSVASVAGGLDNVASGDWASVAGGVGGTVVDEYDSLIGNTPYPDGP